MRFEDTAGVRAFARRPGRYHLHETASGTLLLERAEDAAAPASQLITFGQITGAMTVLEVVQGITANNWQGEVTVVSAGIRRQLRVNRGILTSAESNAETERLGEVMVAHGMLSPEQLKRCLRASGAERRFGETVVLEGLIDPEELFAALQTQARAIFGNALLADSGHYLCTLPDEERPAPAMAIHLPLQRLLMESMQRVDELTHFRERIPSGDVCPATTAAAGRLTLDPRLRPAADLATGKNSVRDIARNLGVDEFTATKLVMQLLQIGYVEILAAHGDDADEIAALVGRLNLVLQHIRSTVEHHGSSERMAWTFRAWVQDTSLGEFFGAVPDVNGSISVELTQKALGALSVVDPLGELRRACIELISFAMFTARPGLSVEVGEALSRWVDEQILAFRR
ncbi:MAG: hypothetical protein OEZ06_04815 [Myxococcales bacterium]|nr:hypothetical protein [Myxococcales bacterium]